MRKLPTLPAPTPCNARPPILTPDELDPDFALTRAEEALRAGHAQIDWQDQAGGKRMFFLRVASERVYGNVFHPVRGPERCAGLARGGCPSHGLCLQPQKFRSWACDDIELGGDWEPSDRPTDVAEASAIEAWGELSDALERLGDRLVAERERSTA